MTAAERRRLKSLAAWADREWAIFAMGYEAGCDLARRAAWDALTEATRKATTAKRAAAAIHEHPTSILDERGDPQPCHDLLEWGRWFEKTANRVLASDEVSGVRVSTVFLGIDHSYDGGVPVLWESMAFGLPDDEEVQERYTSREAAVAGHARLLADVVRRFGS